MDRVRLMTPEVPLLATYLLRINSKSLTKGCLGSFSSIIQQYFIEQLCTSNGLPRWCSVQFSRSVMSDSATPWTATRQASLSIINSWRLLKLMSIESVMPSNHLILHCPLLLPLSIFPNIRVFSNESVLHIRWPKY